MNANKYWKFTGIAVAQIFAGSIVMVVLAPYFSSLGYSESWISAVFGLFPLLMAATGLLLGELSDEMSRSYIIRAALLGTAAAYLLYWLGWESSIITGRVLDAVSFSALVIVLFAKIQDVVDPSLRGRYTGIFLSLRDGARVLGPLAGGFLADKYIGLPFVVAVVVLLLAAFSLRSVKNHQKSRLAVHPLRSLKRFFLDARLLPVAVLGPLINGLLPLFNVFLPLLIVNELGLSYAAVGAAASAYMVGHVSQFFFGELVDRYGELRFMLAGSLLTCLLLLLVPQFGASFYSLLVLVLLIGVCSAMWSVACLEYLSRVGAEQSRGVVLGTYVSISKLGEATAYFTASVVVLFFGVAGVFYVLASLGILGVVLASLLFARANSRLASSA